MDNQINIFIDAYYDNNIGDDLMIQGLVNRYPLINFYTNTNKSIATRTFKEQPNLHFIPFSEFTNNLDNFHMYLKIGGSIFQYHNIKVTIVRYLKNQQMKKFKKRGLKIVTLGSNLGPFKSKLSKFVARSEIKLNDLITVRDRESYELISKTFKLKNVYLFDDIVFEIFEDQNYSNKQNNNNLTLGISAYRSVVRPEMNLKLYQMLASMIQSLNITNSISKVLLFAFDSEDENDLSSAFHVKEMIEEIDSKVDIEVVPYLGVNTTSFLEKYQSSDYLIAVRFHSAILSEIMNIPYFPIAYSNKLTNYVEDSNSHKKILTFDDLDSCENYSISFEDFSNRTKVVETGHFYMLDKVLSTLRK